MKKQKRKIQVLKKLTESEIKTYASNKWSYHYWWVWVLVFVASFVWAMSWAHYYKENLILFLIELAPFAISYVAWTLLYFRCGKKYWERIKNLPEPINLDEIQIY